MTRCFSGTTENMPLSIQPQPLQALPLQVQPAGAGDLAAFIRANTRLLTPPLIPEIKLHLADESVPLWQKTEAQLGEINAPPPYWAFAWAGGQALARFLLDHPDATREKSVLDLGSGSGLTGLAALRAGAQKVIAADIDALAIAACRLNAAANGLVLDVTAADLLAAPPPPCDVVLVGDLFYERQLADRVLAFIESAKALGATVLIGDPQRNYFPKGRFTLLAEYQVPVTRDLEDSEFKTTAVWQA